MISSRQLGTPTEPEPEPEPVAGLRYSEGSERRGHQQHATSSLLACFFNVINLGDIEASFGGGTPARRARGWNQVCERGTAGFSFGEEKEHAMPWGWDGWDGSQGTCDIRPQRASS